MYKFVNESGDKSKFMARVMVKLIVKVMVIVGISVMVMVRDVVRVTGVNFGHSQSDGTGLTSSDIVSSKKYHLSSQLKQKCEHTDTVVTDTCSDAP